MTKKSKMVFQIPVDIAKVYGKPFDLYLPKIEPAKKTEFIREDIEKAYTKPAHKLDIQHPVHSARTSACLQYIKRRDVKKRVFYIFTHGMIFPSIAKTPMNSFLIQTGDICSVTLGKWDSDLLSIFNKHNKFNTLDVFFGKYGPTGPAGQIYELLNMYSPYELYVPKYLFYSSEDLEKKRMMFGIYEKNMDTDSHRQIHTLKDTSGLEHSVDSIFDTGLSSAKLINLLNHNYPDSINFFVETACSVADKIFDFVSYAFPLSITNRPKFYSVNVSGHRNSLLSIYRPEGRTSPKNYTNLYTKNTIPDLSIVFVYDSYTKYMYSVRSLEQLYILYTTYSEYISNARLYVGVHSAESISKESVSKNSQSNMLPSFDDIDYHYRETFKEIYMGTVNGIYVIEFNVFIINIFGGIIGGYSLVL
jgi:hypothetical protein